MFIYTIGDIIGFSMIGLFLVALAIVIVIEWFRNLKIRNWRRKRLEREAREDD